MGKDENIQLIKEIVFKHLDPAKNRAYIFGSRVRGDNSRFSDFDLGIEGEKLPAEIYFSIVQDLEDSDIPYKVDVVEMREVSDRFKDIAKSEVIPVNY